MLTAILAAGVMALTPETFDLTPSDDVWVYPHASEPERDPYLRAWGVSGRSVASKDDEEGTFSYSYLKWNLSTLPKPLGKVVEAKLIVMLVANPDYEEAYAKDHPLEARPLMADFAEKGWVYERLAEVAPSPTPKTEFGTAYPLGLKKDGKETRLVIDLLKGPGDFGKYLAASTGAQRLTLAMTTTMDPGEAGRGAIYKWYSKDTEKEELRPVLHIVIER